jgi:glycosyltransferase involved in cell wall biosynthesis
MKKVLMVAFHYPPYEGGSGVHRTLKFSRYLPDHGWQPIVLSAHPRAYPHVGMEDLADIPSEVVVKRAFALDTARHVSLGGRYLRVTALPDQWVSWWWPAVLAGLNLIRKYRPSIVWSTYPIATAHLIGLTLQRLTGIPWIADFRDSMTEDDYPRDALARRSYQWIERKTVKFCARLVFTAPSTRRMYLDRYPGTVPEKCLVIPNGYDEENFNDIKLKEPAIQYNGRSLRLLHAGVIYPDDRDPRAFFRALSRLKKARLVSGKTLSVDLRASGSEDYYSVLVNKLEIEDLVHLLPSLPYRQALQECAAADALLLFQAASCNHQIPAKVYEYLRLRKPILALTSQQGDTAALLRETSGATIIDLSDEEAIYSSMTQFLSAVLDGTHSLPNANVVKVYARHNQARDLAQCFFQLDNSPESST